MDIGQAITSMMLHKKQSLTYYAQKLGLTKMGLSHIICRNTCTVERLNEIFECMDCDFKIHIADRQSEYFVDAIPAYFGTALSDMLRYKKETILNLSNRTSMSRQWLSHIINNSQSCSVDKLENICDGMNCDLTLFISDRASSAEFIITKDSTTIHNNSTQDTTEVT